MSKKKKTLIAAFAVMGIVVLGLAAAVYAKYVSTLISGTGSANVAKWAFDSDNEDAEFSCDLTGTYKEGTLVDGKIAPGTEGTCDLELSNENSEVGIHYVITITSIEAPSTIVVKNGNTTLTTNSKVEGDMAPGETGKGISLGWKWDYYTSDANDAIDTEFGKTDSAAMKVNYTISAYQLNPTN